MVDEANSNTTGVTSGEITAYPSENQTSTLVFCVAQLFCAVFCRYYFPFVLFYPLYCLPYDLWLLIAFNFSYGTQRYFSEKCNVPDAIRSCDLLHFILTELEEVCTNVVSEGWL